MLSILRDGMEPLSFKANVQGVQHRRGITKAPASRSYELKEDTVELSSKKSEENPKKVYQKS